MAVIEEIDEQVQEMGGEEGKPEGDADEIGKVSIVGAGATVLEDIASPVFLRRLVLDMLGSCLPPSEY